MRQATVNRQTTETQITLTLNLMEQGNAKSTPELDFNHMLELFAAHGRFDLNLQQGRFG